MTAAVFTALVAMALPGKYHTGACTEYSLALGAQLEKAHQHFARIHYRWWTNNESAMHVVIFSRTDDGQEWLADNENRKPFKVSGQLSYANAQKWISKWFSPQVSPFEDPSVDTQVVLISTY